MTAAELAPRTAPTAAVGPVRVVPVHEWDALVGRLGTRDAYLRHGYHVASATLEPPGTVPVLLHVRQALGEVALPLLLRPLDDGWDATTAYGYGGPVARGRTDLAAFGAALDAWARANGVVATFLRLHPLLGNQRLVPPSAELVTAGATVAWDVSPGRDLLAGMHPHHRRAARRADRAGLEVTVDTRPRDLGAFRDLYLATMRRQGADAFFFFGQPYWDALLAEAGALAPVLVEGRLDGQLVSTLLCFASDPWLHYHLGASDDAGRSHGASNRLFLSAAQWAQERGMTRFHLGGGLGGSTDSPLFTFKHRYDADSTPLPFQVAKLVHDRRRYRELAGSDATSGFFPPWRRSA